MCRDVWNAVFEMEYFITLMAYCKTVVTPLLIYCTIRCPVDSPHKGPVMWKAVPCHDIMSLKKPSYHYTDVIMSAIVSQITSLTIVYPIVYSDAVQRKHHSSASLAFVWGIHRGPVNSPHKWPVMRKMFPLDDVIIINQVSARWCEFVTCVHGTNTGQIHPDLLH